ncbi:MAG TPA: DEAD/DEAH box helicase [Methanocorpusculum sp.]|nr:DEAD/DEAH box helicase [Methanocorpusculum sp.]
MTDEYSLLAPFLQKYIYDHGWDDLRDIQARAIRVVLGADYHLLISSGTATGKTEAAFFPALTELDRHPSSSIGILYIGPLKALINDQFARLDPILDQSGIPLWHWHGDVSAAEKRRALRNPSGVVQITPESLESLVMRHPDDLPRLFSDLRFVIIDEVHTFMGQDRGSQLLCLLHRIEHAAGCRPRRIGLSATISEFQDAKAWLGSGTDRAVALARSHAETERRLQVYLSRFSYPQEDSDECSEDELRFYRKLYRAVYGTNAIVFTNSRRDAERIAKHLVEIAEEKGDDSGVFRVHHGSLSAALRRDAEAALKDTFSRTVVIATTTLELGIDIGDLEKVVQIGSPATCSSYLQRLGRSGRRGNIARMQFFCTEDTTDRDSVPERIPWDLLKLIAIIELTDTAGWIEPFVMPKKPFSLLYQQTMSVLYAAGGMKPGTLASRILSMPVFAEITKDEYRTLLRHLLVIGHLERTDDGLLIIGLKNETAVGHYSFLSVFEEKELYHVVAGDQEIGTVERYAAGSPYLMLGGKSWEIVAVHEDRKIIDVVPSLVAGRIGMWHGSGMQVHTRIVRMMREILSSDAVYPYLDPVSSARLQEARELAGRYRLCDRLVYEEQGIQYILPWIGTLEMDTLSRELRSCLFPQCGMTFGPSGRYYLAVRSRLSAKTLESRLHDLRRNPCDPHMLVDAGEEPFHGKYAWFVPRDLRVEEQVRDFIRQDFTYLQ